MASTVKTFSASSTWIAPPGVTTIIAECWGGGGAGGAGTGNPAAGGGGAGGAYAKKATYAVTPGTTYTVTVGAAVTGNTTNTQAQNKGNVSWFSSNDTNGVVAEGGLGGNPATVNSTNGALAAGSSAASFGDGGSVFKGGDGAAGVFGTKGGGGGEGAATTGNGNSAVGGTGGTGSDGGDGGAGGSPGAVGSIGTAPGGGGGGGDANAATDRAGGNGAAGQVKLTYTTPLTSALNDAFDGASLDTTKWTNASFNSGAVTESGGTLICTPNINTANTGAEVDSLEFYDLTGSFILVKIPQTVVQNGATYFQVAIDGNNKLFFQNDGSPLVLKAIKVVANVSTTIASATYNSTTMAWWRIRESGGTTYWEVSSDGISWSELNGSCHATNPITVTSLKITLEGYDFTSESAAGAAKFDNFNIPPSISWFPNSISQPLSFDSAISV